jgi:outer membrane beta-barrel protein
MSMGRNVLTGLAVLGLLVAAPEPAQAENASGDIGRTEGKNLRDRLRSVQRRHSRKTGRFSVVPTYSLTVNDPLVTTHTAGGSLYYHLAEGFAFVLGGDLTLMTQKNDYVDLLRTEERLVLAEPTPAATAGLGISYSPIYGKVALFSDWVVHYDVFLEGRAGLTDIDGGWKPTGIFGIGGRVYLGQALSIDIGVRSFNTSHTYRGVEDIKNLMFFHSGLAVYLPFTNRTRR